jgi:nicotinamidase-related amidase
MQPDLSAIPHVEAQVLPAMIEPARTALVVIDVQEDFVGPTGAMARIGVDMSGVGPALDRVDDLIAAARAAGATLAFARVVTSDESDSSALKLLNARKGRPPFAIAICREDQPGSAYHRVAPRPGEIEVPKRLFNTFFGTRFDEDLRARGIDTLVVVGFTTDCCVDATCRDAFHRDYSVFVVSDATDAYAPDLHLGALKALQKNCALITDTAAVLAAWGGPAA